MRFSCQGKQNIWPFSSCPGSCSLRKIKILRSRGHLGIWKASVISINSCSRLEADLLFKSRAIFLYGRVLVLSSSIISDALDGVSSYDWTFPEAGSWRLEVSQVALSMLFSKCFHLAKGVREFCPLDGAASEGATSLNGSSRRHRTCLRYLLTNWLTFNSFTQKNDQKWPWFSGPEHFFVEQQTRIDGKSQQKIGVPECTCLILPQTYLLFCELTDARSSSEKYIADGLDWIWQGACCFTTDLPTQ